jgi:hypothetical protein
MTIAEAIRAGSSRTYQTFGNYMTHDRGEITGACAFGAALVGYHKTSRLMAIPNDSPVWRIAIGADCPACGVGFHCAVLEHLNDIHRWTREDIAEWLVRSGLDREIATASLPDCSGCVNPDTWDSPGNRTHQAGTKQHPQIG